MKSFLTLFFVFASVALFGKPLSVSIETPHAILMNLETGEILFEKGAHTAIYPASTMKVATLLNVLEKSAGRLEEQIAGSADALQMVSEKEKVQSGFTLPPYILEKDGNRIGMRVGEKFSVRNLLSAAMVVSANDACNVLAEGLSGSIPTFVDEMNEMAKRLGCKNTHFSNPHGLHQPEHVSTAYDMALIAKEALKYPLFLEIALESKYVRPKVKGQTEKEHKRRNDRLGNKESPYFYPKASQIKTGYHWRAKHNLIAIASNGERKLLVVLHKSPTAEGRYRDAIALFESAFKEDKVQRPIFRKGEMRFERKVKKGKGVLLADFKEDIYIEYFPSEEPVLHTKLIWHDLALPISLGKEVGEVHIFDAFDRCVKKEPIFAQKEVVKRGRFWGWFFLGIFALGGGALGVAYFRFSNRYNKSSMESS